MAMTYPFAQGHADIGGKPAVARPFADNAATWPAGSVFTNVKEYARYAIAFMNKGAIDGRQVLSPAVIRKLSTPYVTIPGSPDVRYGYGLRIQEERGMKLLEHEGSRTGYGSALRMAPEHRYAVIVISNKTGVSMPRTVERALEIGLPLKPKATLAARDALPMSGAEMISYSGVYENGVRRVEISVRAGKLMLTKDGQDFTLRKLGSDRLAFQEPGASGLSEIVVVSGADVKPAYVFDGGRSLARVRN
jgi:hypothetical protein